MESIGGFEIWLIFFTRFIPVWICLAIFYFCLFYWRKKLGLMGRLCDSPIGLIGLFIVLFWILGAILADWVAILTHMNNQACTGENHQELLMKKLLMTLFYMGF